MTFYAINGSPRKRGNTAVLLDKALQGVKDVIPDADTKIIHVYDYSYTGCVSCYACKRKGGKYYGRCAKKDAISSLLPELSQADGLIIGSPVYFHSLTGQLQAFLERLLYPYLAYGKEYYSIAPKHMPVAFVYTMNATEEKAQQMNHQIKLSPMEEYAGVVFSPPAVLYCYDTCQFDDYKRYMAQRFSEEKKLQRRQEHFPIDCENARGMGRAMAQKITGQNPTAEGSPGRI